MVPRLIRDTRPAGSAAGDSVIAMREDESALILIKHCNDMKQQEARLRLITLLLLLVNMALLLFTNRLSPWHQGSFASAGRGVSPRTFLLRSLFLWQTELGCLHYYSSTNPFAIVKLSDCFNYPSHSFPNSQVTKYFTLHLNTVTATAGVTLIK